MDKDILKFNQYFSLNENKYYIPNVKLDEFLKNVEYAKGAHIKAIEAYYNTYEQYISIEDKKKHFFKVNDITGDILNNNRVVLKAYCFHDNDLDVIKKNVIDYVMNSFYSELPENFNLFNINIPTVSYIDKTKLKEDLDENISKDTITKIISIVTKSEIKGVQNDFVIFEKKEQ